MNYLKFKRIFFSSRQNFNIAAASLLAASGTIKLAHLKYLSRVHSHSPLSRIGMAFAIFDLAVKAASRSRSGQTPECRILGTRKRITRDAWHRRLHERKIDASDRQANSCSQHIKQGFGKRTEPLVSIITSLYNGERYIERFLAMVIGQSIFHRCELIIIDANSKDNSKETIEAYAKKFQNIKYVQLPLTVTVYQAWNLAIQLSRSKYITNWNVDDIREERSLELQVGFLDDNHNASVTYQDVFYTLDYDLEYSEIEAINLRTRLPNQIGLEIFDYNIPHNAPMWRRELHDDIGFFEPTFLSAGDWEFWLRCFCAGKSFLKNPTMHVAYYFNPDGLSTSKCSKGIEESKRVRASFTLKFFDYVRNR